MKELEYPFDSNYVLSNKRRIKKELLSLSDNFIEKKIAILGGSTTNAVKDTLEIFLLNQGIKASFYESEYNQYYEDAIFSNESLDEFNPDIVYIFTTVKNIMDFPSASCCEEEMNAWINSVKEKYISMWNALRERISCVIIQNNFELPEYRLMGNYDAVNIHGATNIVQKLNYWMAGEVRNRDNLYLCDINYISSDLGLKNWYDTTAWYMYKYALSLDSMVNLSFNISNIIKALYGKNKKGYVLDLDNTLWGGVIGEDGQEGIALGPELPLGQAYCDFQCYLKKHKEMGVILNINSKNDWNNALLGLNHPNGILKQEDFIVIKANWEPKDINFVNIAETLNIFPDSLVFVDDNPAERLIVSAQIQGVTTPEIGKVTDYIRILDHSGYFEVVSLSSDDEKRNEMYKENVARIQLQTKFSNYGEYLKNLKMKANIVPFDKTFFSRIAQLTNKSNQFNLTTRRYSQPEIEQIAQMEDRITLCGKLEDRFGDNGIVSLVIGEVTDEKCEIQLWLMSCRVLKRDMECAMMDCLVEECKKRSIKKLVGIYIPTEKNEMVASFYRERGFSFLCEEGGKTKWELDLSQKYIKQNKYIEIGE